MKQLPEDLSSLPNLQSINLKGNSFTSMKKIINSLKTLPKLKKLQINISSLDDREDILAQLPNLSFLNDERNLEK